MLNCELSGAPDSSRENGHGVGRSRGAQYYDFLIVLSVSHVSLSIIMSIGDVLIFVSGDCNVCRVDVSSVACAGYMKTLSFISFQQANQDFVIFSVENPVFSICTHQRKGV